MQSLKWPAKHLPWLIKCRACEPATHYLICGLPISSPHICWLLWRILPVWYMFLSVTHPHQQINAVSSSETTMGANRACWHLHHQELNYDVSEIKLVLDEQVTDSKDWWTMDRGTFDWHKPPNKPSKPFPTPHKLKFETCLVKPSETMIMDVFPAIISHHPT